MLDESSFSWSRPPRIDRLIIPNVIVEQTLNHFQSSGRKGLEGIAYWGAHMYSASSSVTLCSVFIPDAKAVRTQWGLTVDVATKALAEVLSAANSFDLFLVAKVHSHPDDQVCHSDRDDTSSMRSIKGFLSIVVPRFGSKPNPIENWGFHEVQVDATWRRWLLPEVSSRVHIVPTMWNGVREHVIGRS